MTDMEQYLQSKRFPTERSESDLLGLNGIKRSWDLREECRKKYSFAILTETMIARIKELQPILEVGAGLGYWAHEFQKRGVDYVATDPHVGVDNTYFENTLERWTDIRVLRADQALLQFPGRSLLMCWPGYGDPWAFDALMHYRGNNLIYVGEEEGGCCANDDFFESLREEWEEVEELDMPQFVALHDRAFIFKRSRPLEIKIEKRKINWKE